RFGQGRTQSILHGVKINIFVMTRVMLARRSEDWLRQMTGQLQVGREGYAAHFSRALVFLEPTSDQVAAYDTFIIDATGLFNQHRPPIELAGITKRWGKLL